ncbi:MAG TPA: hypothetical protein VH413_04100 [Verrucomicrobiae bacterium]|jgi:Tfp pilus assembly protein PilX|nr:hypothetical protein [Verrucomicrobiae bacterium]
MKRQSQQGVALVITLILLSVITFMAVTFLVVSRKEAAQVNTLTQQSNSKFASEAAVEEAKAQIIAQMLATGNGLNFGLLVSTNYQMTNFFHGVGLASITNVSYTGLAAGDVPQLMNNLQILPRVPVFIATNKGSANLDFRFYLDLNRNGRYDTNGVVENFDSNGLPILDASQHPTFSTQVGDPEWIGILAHPDQRHSSSNQFVARYCFIALPIGNSLDVNYSHNQSQQIANMSAETDEGYLRNQGFGSWEINLAGFLNALNTNSWPTANFKYAPLNTTPPWSLGFQSGGEAFNDAASIVQYRYNNSYSSLLRFTDMFSSLTAAPSFGNDFIDGFCNGPLMTNTFALTNDRDFNSISAQRTWSGSSPAHPIFTTQDFFAVPGANGQPVSSFTNHLRAPGLSRGTYDRYTYYRMLAQMSFGSAPESSATYNTNTVLPSPGFLPAYPGYYPYTNRLNLNYNNIGALNATNFQPWDALTFFSNTANRLLANAGYTFTVTNIPLYPINEYTPAVHRLLQVAANIYDATTNRFTNNAEGTLFYPSVFRPVFNKGVGTSNIFISGYVEEAPINFVAPKFTGSYSSTPLSLPEQANQFVPTLAGGNTTSNLYGVPWIIGAKKGLPNFNEFSMASVSQITRKLEVINMNAGSSPPKFQTNVQYTIGVSNLMGVEAWNSYTNFYGRSVDLIGSVVVQASVSNFDGLTLRPLALVTTNVGWLYTLSPGAWPGAVVSSSSPHVFNNSSFQIPLMTNIIMLTNSVYHQFPTPHLSPGTNFDVPAIVFQPHFIYNCTNYLRFIVQDHTTGRILDYVTLNGMNYTRDLTAELPGPLGANYGGPGGVWLTNIQSRTVPQGMQNQITISSGLTPTGPPFTSANWINDTLQGNSQQSATGGFAAFLNGQGGITNSMQAPYTPTRKVALIYHFQVNDPLVHYTLSDISPQPFQNTISTNYPTLAAGATIATNYLDNIGLPNQNYRPWGDVGTPNGTRTDPMAKTDANYNFKDSQVTGSDAWQFPTNKFPNIGWLGRVHRGTPWQTLYLKSVDSSVMNITNWQMWTGNVAVNQFAAALPVNSADALLTTPTNDWSILDLFTTAPNDNASRGQLSVNQTNFAAWAGILDGVIVVSNGPSGQIPMMIDPRANNLALQQILNGIYSARTNTAMFPAQVFTSVGQVLSAPQLTVASPYLNTTGNTTAATYPNDAEMERIPQQIMSLLRVGSPRYVIFAYGQSLKPADHSIIQSSGPFFGMCTNYTITGEVATRTVLRIDNPPVPGRTVGSPQAVVEAFNVIPPE